MTAQRRHLIRHADGGLVDQEGREITLEELAAGLGAGERFQVVDEVTTQRCTFEVLAAVMRLRLADQPDPMVALLGTRRPSELRHG